MERTQKWILKTQQLVRPLGRTRHLYFFLFFSCPISFSFFRRSFSCLRSGRSRLDLAFSGGFLYLPI